MRAFIDLNLARLILAPGVTSPVAQLRFKRSATATLELQFCRGRDIIELAADATGAFEMKTVGKYDMAALVTAGNWVKTGTGVNALYTFTFSFISAALNTLFEVDDDPSNDVPRITLMAEIEWITERFAQKTQTFSAAIDNDINRDTD